MPNQNRTAFGSRVTLSTVAKLGRFLEGAQTRHPSRIYKEVNLLDPDYTE
jgi:hypothetical protein